MGSFLNFDITGNISVVVNSRGESVLIPANGTITLNDVVGAKVKLTEDGDRIICDAFAPECFEGMRSIIKIKRVPSDIETQNISLRQTNFSTLEEMVGQMRTALNSGL